ncbi:MAG: TolC family protein [Desulfobacteraceae bacterium]|nr:MAG: TolC family protein [Desulfobacteraceae bacterium]
MVILCAAILFSLYGCAERERYAYERVKTTYKAEAALSPAVEIPPTPPLRVPGEPLSLHQAIVMGIQGNPDVEMALARIRQAQAMIDEATASFWPVISAYGEYLQGNAPSSYLFKTIDQRMLPPMVDFNNPGWFENYEVGLQARINLFNGGRDLLRRKMAETGLQIQELDRRSVENGLVESVIHAYFQALAARDYLEIAAQSVETVEEQKRVVEVRYRGGGALRSDLLSLEVRLAQAKEEMVRARNNRDLSLAALAILLSLDPDSQLRLRGEASIHPDFPKEYASGLNRALATRPELKKVRQQVVQSYMALDMARAEVLPKLDAQYKAYMDDESADFSTSRDNWIAAVVLNWDIFTGLSTPAKVSRARSVLDEMIALDRKTTQSVQLELKSAYLKLAEAGARLEVTRASVAQAEESLSLVKKEYEGGSADITRYLEAELALHRASILAKAAYYDRQRALASVGRGIGYWANYVEEMRKIDGK